MKKSYGVVVFKQKAGRILFLLVKSKIFKFWGFPKGYFEPAKDKTMKAAAAREVREETGLAIKFIPGFRKTIKYFLSGHILKKVTFFMGRALNTKIKLSPEEISASQWSDLAKAERLLDKTNLKVLLQQAAKYLQKYVSN